MVSLMSHQSKKESGMKKISMLFLLWIISGPALAELSCRLVYDEFDSLNLLAQPLPEQLQIRGKLAHITQVSEFRRRAARTMAFRDTL